MIYLVNIKTYIDTSFADNVPSENSVMVFIEQKSELILAKEKKSYYYP